MMIRSSFQPASYQMAHHGGSGWRVPAFATARRIVNGREVARVEISGDDFPNLDEAQLCAKAEAMLRAVAPRRA